VRPGRPHSTSRVDSLRHMPALRSSSLNSRGKDEPQQNDWDTMTATTASRFSTVTAPGKASRWRPCRRGNGYVASCSAGGMDNGRSKENQDSSFLLERASDSGQSEGCDFLAGVVDGHGSHGGRVSHFVRRRLASEILRHRRENPGTRAAMQHGFVSTAVALGEEGQIDSRESGAAVAVCMKRGEDLYVANVGDARAVLVADGAGRVRGVPLSQDHTPMCESERNRVDAAGGTCEPILVPGMGYIGPPRVWRHAQMAGGLSVTRAIGDTSLASSGVTPRPEVMKRRLRPEDKMVVLASDGCWDYVSNDRAAELAMRHAADPSGASKAIVQEARKKWQNDPRKGGYIDDITCVVAKV